MLNLLGDKGILGHRAYKPWFPSQQVTSCLTVIASMECPSGLVNQRRYHIRYRRVALARATRTGRRIREKPLPSAFGLRLRNSDDNPAAGLRPLTAVAVLDGRIEINGILGLEMELFAGDLKGQ